MTGKFFDTEDGACWGEVVGECGAHLCVCVCVLWDFFGRQTRWWWWSSDLQCRNNITKFTYNNWSDEWCSSVCWHVLFCLTNFYNSAKHMVRPLDEDKQGGFNKKVIISIIIIIIFFLLILILLVFIIIIWMLLY